MKQIYSFLNSAFFHATLSLLGVAFTLGGSACGQETAGATAVNEEAIFKSRIQPLMQKFCTRCHAAEITKSGVRVDQLAALPDVPSRHILRTIESIRSPSVS